MTSGFDPVVGGRDDLIATLRRAAAWLHRDRFVPVTGSARGPVASRDDEIDRVLSSMLSQQRPGYLEVPRDLIGVAIEGPTGDLAIELPPVDEVALAQAVADIVEHLAQSRTAAIHAGVMVQIGRAHV